MAKANPDVILLKGEAELREEFPLEALAVCLDNEGAITPGMLVEVTTSNTVRPHSTSAGVAAPVRFADTGLNFAPDSLTMGGIDDDYDTDGQAVKIFIPNAGAMINALLAVGQNVANQALLESNGDGTLKAGTTNPIVRATEAVNNSAGTTAARIEVVRL